MKQRGFTLVEIAIVLVIIGFILGGILNSQSLISSAKAKDVMTIVEDLRTATTFFKQRYNYLPGDWPYTANEIPNVTAASGNGNGSINGAINAQGQATANSEVADVPWHLFNAGLIGKIDNSDVQRRIRTVYGAVHIAAAATVTGLVPNFTAANANPAVRNAIVFYNLPCNIVAEVDNKIDDGVSVYAAPPGTNGRAFGTACVNDAVTWYAVAL